MKLNKKKVFVMALAVALVAILSFSTLAWFNDSKSITNNFYVSTSDNVDGTPDFSVRLYETDDTTSQGTTETGKTYDDINPGEVLDKDPTVVNTGDYDQYVRAIITLSDATQWLNAVDNDVAVLEILMGTSKNAAWQRFEAPVYNTTADTITYVYYYNAILTPAQESTIFETITIPGYLTQEDMNYGAGNDAGFTIDVKVDAIQSDNILPENPQLAGINEAYYAFNTVARWTAGAAYPVN